MRFGDIVDFKVTNSFSRENLNYEVGTVKNIHYGDIHTKFQTLFDITQEKAPYINEDISINRISVDCYCKEGDVIFADASEDLEDVGKSIEVFNLNNEKLLAGLHTLLARPKPGYFKKGFVGYLFKSANVRDQIKKEAQGSKVLSINVGRISNIKLTFPSNAEQEKITGLLSAIDTRIKVSSKIIRELECLKLSLSKKVFSNQLKFKDGQRNNFPNWELKKLGEIGETYSGLTGKTKENFGTGKPYIQYKQIFDKSKIDISRCGFVSVVDNENQKRVKKGDVFFTVSSETPEEIGMSSVLLDDVDEMYLNSFCFGFRSNSDERLKPSFSRYLFRSDIFRNEIIKLAQGSTRYNMSKISFMKLKVHLPCIEEQIKIADFFSTLDNKITTESHLLKKFEQQKKHLLSSLFI